MGLAAVPAGVVLWCVTCLASGCANVAPQRESISVAERAALQAMVADADHVLRLLSDAISRGEPITPSFVSTYCGWSRRRCLAAVEAADDGAAKAAAVDTHAKRMEEFDGIINGQSEDQRSGLALVDVKYHLHEARLWAARVAEGQPPASGEDAPPGAASQALPGGSAELIREKVVGLHDRMRAGEPLTSAFIDECALTRRRLGLAEINAATDRGASVAAAQRHVEQARLAYEVLAYGCNQSQQPRPQITQLRFFFHEAEWWLVRTRGGAEPATNPG